MKAQKELLKAVEHLAKSTGQKFEEAIAITCRAAVMSLRLALAAKLDKEQARMVERSRCFDFVFDFGMELGEEHFGEPAVGAAMAYLHAVAEAPPFTDVFCELHQTLVGSKYLDQHFTPPDIAALVSELASSHHRRFPPKGRQIYEPCCGSGALLLAYLAKTLKDDGRDGLARLHVEGNDLDPLCSLMTATRIFANEVAHGAVIGAVRITVGNALTEKVGHRPIHCSLRHDYSQRIAYEELLRRLMVRETQAGAAAEAAGETAKDEVERSSP